MVNVQNSGKFKYQLFLLRLQLVLNLSRLEECFIENKKCFIYYQGHYMLLIDNGFKSQNLFSTLRFEAADTFAQSQN